MFPPLSSSVNFSVVLIAQGGFYPSLGSQCHSPGPPLKSPVSCLWVPPASPLQSSNILVGIFGMKLPQIWLNIKRGDSGESALTPCPESLVASQGSEWTPRIWRNAPTG